MTTMWFVIPVAVLLLAFVNGANDNAKGVATLIGSRTMSLRGAVRLAAATTFLGSITAIFLADLLLVRFSGRGIVADETVAATVFPACVGLAAGLTVLLATCLSIPVSTTHALVGAIVGVGWAGGGLNWGSVFAAFLIPLLASPLIAMVLAAFVYLLFRQCRRHMGVTQQTCLCVDRRYEPVRIGADGGMTVQATGVVLRRGEVDACRRVYAGRLIGVDAQRVLDASHVLSAAALSFARGLNDTPKIAALMLAAGAGSRQGAVTAVGVGIAAGGLLAVRRVARTMSYRITDMNDGQAFSANLVAAALVIAATLKFGVPVSTTHTSCGSLFGIGAVNRRAHWPTIGRIALAWALTLPVAASAGWLCWHVLGG